jgi:hypothetical protein
MKKVRLIKLIVLPVAVLDDGESLTEIEVEQMTVPSEAIEEFVESGLREALRSLAQEFETD